MRSFKIEIKSVQIEDLKIRLANSRWPDEISDVGWAYGTNMDYLRKLCFYWHNEFNWTAQETFLNQLKHYKTENASQNLHFIYQKGKGVINLPIILIHGWPDSFYRFIKLIPLLTEPDANGIAFDVIIPSIPGYGFSDKPKESGMGTWKIATLFNKLMKETLGYDRFYAHGGDWGASIATQMAIQCPESIIGLHLTNVPPELFYSANFANFNDKENEYLKKSGQWQKEEGAYLSILGSKPQTIAYGLNDSPSGLAAWIIEKFNSWSDNKGDIENSFTKDELLTNISIYWFTQTAGSAGRIYYEAMRQAPVVSETKIDVPAYFSVFPADPIQIPEDFARKIFKVLAWTKMPSGGHFAALETPELLSFNIRNSFKVNT